MQATAFKPSGFVVGFRNKDGSVEPAQQLYIKTDEAISELYDPIASDNVARIMHKIQKQQKEYENENKC